MKTIQIRNILTVLAIVLATAPAMAQTGEDNETKYNTGVSIRQQLMNGTAPGLKFAPTRMRSAQQSKLVAGKDESKRSLSEEIKNGTLGGVPVSGGGSKPTFRAMSKPAVLNRAASGLSSDKPAEVTKPAAPAPAATLPTQGEEKAPAAKTGKAPAKEAGKNE